MRRDLQALPRVEVLQIAVLLAAPTLVMTTRPYGSIEEFSPTEIVPEVNFEDNIASDDAASAGSWAWAWAWARAVADAPWLGLLLPFIVGLGALQATLFHAAACCAVAKLKARGERGGWWAAAGAMGAACGAQVLLLAGLGLVAQRVLRDMRRGAFASASGFGAFFPGHAVWEPLQPFLWATPVLIICYWLMLNILCKIEEKKKRSKKEQNEKLVEGYSDISVIKVTKL